MTDQQPNRTLRSRRYYPDYFLRKHRGTESKLRLSIFRGVDRKISGRNCSSPSVPRICLQGVDDDWTLSRTAYYRGRVPLATQQLLQGALRIGQGEVAELRLTAALDRGLDVARLINGVHAN